MKRRNFLKTVAGILGAAFVGAKVEGVSAYNCAPRGMPFVLNETTQVFPELSAPVADLHGPPLTIQALESLRSKMWELNAMQPMRGAIVGDRSGRIYVLPEPLDRE